jgi:SNF family Na+-dependent transporter
LNGFATSHAANGCSGFAAARARPYARHSGFLETGTISAWEIELHVGARFRGVETSVNLAAASGQIFFTLTVGFGIIINYASYLWLSIAEFTDSMFSLGFKALPNIFAWMWGGQLFGFLGFSVLFIAAITSSVSKLQPVIAFS